MRKIFVHGDNTVLSRQFLMELISSGSWQVFNSRNFLENPGFLEAGLFGQTSGLLFEFFDSQEVKKLDLEKLKTLMASDVADSVFWFGFEVSQNSPLIKLLRDLKFGEKKFNLSPQVFKIVDSFFSLGIKDSSFYQRLGDRFDWEREGTFLLQLLIKRTRQVFWAYYRAEAFKKIHPFVQKKVAANNQNWGSAQKLLFLLEKLIRLDQDLKSREVDLPSRLLLIYERLAV